MTHNILQEKISKLASAYQSDSMEFDYSVLEIPEKDLTTFIEDIILHTIEQTIKEGELEIEVLRTQNENSVDYECGESWSTHGYPKALTDIQRALRGIIG